MTEYNNSEYSDHVSCPHPIPINISFFHNDRSVSAELVDHSSDEICFVSKQFFLQGTPVIFRIDYKSVNPENSNYIDRLPSINVGEITSCNELSSESTAPFKVGVRFYPQPY